jgi:hypothetical protein
VSAEPWSHGRASGWSRSWRGSWPSPTETRDRLNGRMVERLPQLTHPALQARLDGALTRGQIDALLERRDALLSRVETLITEKGEEAVLF